MSWIWVLSFSVLGSQPEHGQQAKFETLQACQQAIVELRVQQAQRGREIVATCFLQSRASKGWW